MRELDVVFTSDRPRSRESAKALAPHAALVADPLFAEAPLAAPPLPLTMGVPSWAVVARLLWHAGYHPEIENYRKAKHRAAQAAGILIARAREGAWRRACCAWLLQHDDRARAAPSRIFQARIASGALLECGDL